jgi:hypothetical protein
MANRIPLAIDPYTLDYQGPLPQIHGPIPRFGSQWGKKVK